MKPLLVFLSAALLCSCGSDKSTSQEKENVTVERVVGDDNSSSSDSSSDVEELSSSTNSSSSEDWDSVLDSYETYINDYIKLIKKAQAGDVNAMSEYASILEQAQELQTKLQNAQSELTPAQVTRLTKMMTKMTSSVSSM